jgi:hypothetical protein
MLRSATAAYSWTQHVTASVSMTQTRLNPVKDEAKLNVITLLHSAVHWPRIPHTPLQQILRAIWPRSRVVMAR